MKSLFFLPIIEPFIISKENNDLNFMKLEGFVTSITRY